MFFVIWFRGLLKQDLEMVYPRVVYIFTLELEPYTCRHLCQYLSLYNRPTNIRAKQIITTLSFRAIDLEGNLS